MLRLSSVCHLFHLPLILLKENDKCPKITGAGKSMKVSQYKTCKWLKFNTNDSTVTQPGAEISDFQNSLLVPLSVVEQSHPQSPLHSSTYWHFQLTDGWCNEWVSATKAKTPCSQARIGQWQSSILLQYLSQYFAWWHIIFSPHSFFYISVTVSQ